MIRAQHRDAGSPVLTSFTEPGVTAGRSGPPRHESAVASSKAREFDLATLRLASVAIIAAVAALVITLVS